MSSTTRVLVGTLVGGLGVGVGAEWWRAERAGDTEGGAVQEKLARD